MMLYRFVRPDLVITDILMPLKDGLAVIAEMTELYPGVKIIAMAARREQLKEARQIGAQLTVVKPVVPNKLIRAVCRVTHDMTEKD